MKLPARSTRPRIPVTPFANIALLVLGGVAVTAFYAVARGPGFRFATFAEVGGFSKEAAPVRVDVASGGVVAVDGEQVPEASLAAAVASRLARSGSASVLLVISPDVSYGRMLADYGAIAALPRAPRIAIPPRSWVEGPGSRAAADGGTMAGR